MVKFMAKSFFLCLVLLIGVIIGIQQANEGLKKMRGYETTETLGALPIHEKENGELEASILGNKLTSQDIKKKQEQLERIESFNFFSELGKWLSNCVQTFMSTMIHLLSEQIEQWLNKDKT
jgi:hypothetical protein